MEHKESLPIDTILDSGVREYKIQSVLGKGGFGITYLATSTIQVGNIPAVMQFAIKEHYISSMNERQGASVSISNVNNTEEIKESIDSFLVEAQRLNKLSLKHSGIVRVNESFRANGTAYYVMEYIKGQSLRDYVKNSSLGRLSEEEALKLFRPIAETISFLHNNMVTHLDIKPDNILIRENGEPVVIDFGLSKHYNSKGTPTSTIKAAGCSAGYSPMEQYAGITTFSPEADIYALGATLLYMLTGKDPMISTEINETIIRRSIPQGVSQRVTGTIIRSMGKLKEDRYHNVSDFLPVLSKDGKLDEGVVKDNVGERSENKTKKLPLKSTQKPIHWKIITGVMGCVFVVLLANILFYAFGGGSSEPNNTSLKEISFTSCPDDNHPHKIDLGLPSGTKWACCNLGANFPEQYGEYYRWGETKPFRKGDTDATYPYNGVDIGNNIAGTKYDAATANWGTPWHMPTGDQMKELLDNCTYKWATLHGVKGGMVIGRNGSTIFLPASGERIYYSGVLGGFGSGNYWSASPYSSTDGLALYLNSNQLICYDAVRAYGFSVRAVAE